MNELRINNWVYVLINNNIKGIKPVRLGQVKAVSENILIEYRDNKEPSSSIESAVTIEPVPLTREWLKRTYFQTVKSSEKFETMQFNGLELSYYKQNGSITARLNKAYLDKCYHVHAFQNLYQDTTGEQLWL